MSTIDTVRLAYASEKLLHALLNEDLGEVVRTAYSIFETPVFVINSLGKFLYLYPEHPIGNDHWDSFVKTRTSTLEGHFATQKYYKEHVPEGKHVVFLDKNKGYSGEPCIMGQFYENQVIAGHIGVFMLNGAIPDETDMAIAEVFRQIVSKLVPLSMSPYNVPGSSSFLLHALTDSVSEQELEIAKLGFDPPLKGDFLVLTAPVPDPYLNSALPYYMCSMIVRECPQVLHAVYSDSIVLVLTNLSKRSSADPLHSETVKGVVRLLSDNGFSCGISSGFSDVRELKIYYEQAKLTVSAGHLLQPHAGVYSFQDLMPYQMLFPVTQLQSPGTLIHPVVLAMKDYDRGHNTEYLKTYREYVLSGKDKHLAAEALHIHLNTLNYRLDKIDELFRCYSLSKQDNAAVFCSLLLTDLMK